MTFLYCRWTECREGLGGRYPHEGRIHPVKERRDPATRDATRRDSRRVDALCFIVLALSMSCAALNAQRNDSVERFSVETYASRPE